MLQHFLYLFAFFISVLAHGHDSISAAASTSIASIPPIPTSIPDIQGSLMSYADENCNLTAIGSPTWLKSSNCIVFTPKTTNVRIDFGTGEWGFKRLGLFTDIACSKPYEGDNNGTNPNATSLVYKSDVEDGVVCWHPNATYDKQVGSVQIDSYSA